MPTNTPPDDRPRFAICHVGLTAADPARLGDFYQAAGLRRVGKMTGMSILELRGGTHIVISRGAPGASKLDLMVDDLEQAHELFARLGANPTQIVSGSPHDTFHAIDPEGNDLLIETSHVVGSV